MSQNSACRPAPAAVRQIRRLSNTITVPLVLVQAADVIALLSAAFLISWLRTGRFEPDIFLSYLTHTGSSDALYNVFDTLVYLAYMLAPLLCIAAVLRQDPLRVIPGRVRRPRLAAPAAAAALLLFALGDLYSNYFAALLARVHLQVSLPQLDFPAYNGPALLVYVLQVAVAAPLCEEFLFRGIILQNLRRYGDLFAVLVSSALFGLLHGNLAQTPFAFLAGVGLALVMIETGSIWVGVALHCFNNAFSIVLGGLAAYYGDHVSGAVYTAYLALLALFILLTLPRLRGSGYFRMAARRYGAAPLPAPLAVKAFVQTPGCILFILIYAGSMLLSLRPL